MIQKNKRGCFEKGRVADSSTETAHPLSLSLWKQQEKEGTPRRVRRRRKERGRNWDILYSLSHLRFHRETTWINMRTFHLGKTRRFKLGSMCLQKLKRPKHTPTQNGTLILSCLSTSGHGKFNKFINIQQCTKNNKENPISREIISKKEPLIDRILYRNIGHRSSYRFIDWMS